MATPYIRCPTPTLAEEALKLEWAFGLNNDFKACVHNLSTGTQQRSVFYALAHIGVLYDAIHNTQQHLLGHRYTIISSSCCAHNHRFLVTADEGDVEVRQRIQQNNLLSQTAKMSHREQNDDGVEDAEAQEESAMQVDPIIARCDDEEDGSTMIVWDAVTALPLKVIPTGKYGGVLSVAMSPDGQYLATLNCRDPQEIMIWSWTQQQQDSAVVDLAAAVAMAPVFVRRIAARDEQTSISFSQDHPELLCTNGLHRVTFWSWKEGVLKYYSPPILQRRLKASVGNFTHTVFVPGTTMACSGTVDGDVVLWALQPQDRVMKEQDKTLFKMVRVHAGGVTVLTTVQGYLVTGGMDGTVKFLDAKLRLVAWFEDFNGGPVVSISFDRVPPITNFEDARTAAPGEVESHLLINGTAAAAMFTAPDFMVSTAHSMIIDVPAKAFHTTGGQTSNGKSGAAEVARGRLIVQGQDRAVQSLAAHPRLPRLAIGGYSGNLHLWDYAQRRVVLLSLFRNLLIRCMTFDPAGKWLVVGFTNGVVKVLHAETLEEVQTLRPTSSSGAAAAAATTDDAVTAPAGATPSAVGNRSRTTSLVPPDGASSIDTGTRGKASAADTATGMASTTATAAAATAPAARTAISVEQICFSADSRLMATATADGHVGLYEYVTSYTSAIPGSSSSTAAAGTAGIPKTKKAEWQLVGHHKTHKAAICGLHFGHNTGAGEEAVRLLSVGADKRLIEYDLVNSTPETGFVLRAAHKISQESVPTGFLWLPDDATLLDAASRPRDFYQGMNDSRTDEAEQRKGSSNNSAHDVLLIANDEYKLQAYLSNWSRQCIKTVLGPTFGGPVTHMVVAPVQQSQQDLKEDNGGQEDASHCLVYATAEKVIGLVQLPLRGDPLCSIGLLAHPGSITSMVASYDGQFVFTAGGPDQAVMQWRVKGEVLLPPAELAAVRQCTEKGGVPLRHLVNAVEGGAEGELMKEVVDYFYYAQIRAQGEETTAKRVLLGAIPFSQMPNLLRSLGYYPSEMAIGHMTYEVANMYGPPDEPLADVDVDAILLDFSQFMRFYVNYRPVFGITRKGIEAAFRALGADPVTGEINRDHLFHLLSTIGEALKANETAAALTSLLGDGIRLEMLEDVITARTFAENLLGFEDYDDAAAGDGEGGAAGKHGDGAGGEGAGGLFSEDVDDESSGDVSVVGRGDEGVPLM
jgi:cilia- and flagella-associated protein 251